MSRPVYVETIDGYGILFEAVEEDTSARQHFVKECGWSEAEFRRLRGMAWFCARVSAWKNGVELGVKYLGCCSYRSEREFYTTYHDDYFLQMAKEAVEEARATEARAARPAAGRHARAH